MIFKTLSTSYSPEVNMKVLKINTTNGDTAKKYFDNISISMEKKNTGIVVRAFKDKQKVFEVSSLKKDLSNEEAKEFLNIAKNCSLGKLKLFYLLPLKEEVFLWIKSTDRDTYQKLLQYLF
jgi:hypothetical protein